MESFETLNAVAIPLAIANLDTDQIVPARFLWRKRHDGWGHLLFHDLRLHEDGSPEAGFILNEPFYQNAQILVADRNFGCGSSREHAVWALRDYGIKAVIAPSFGDIFANNCYQNGLLPVTLPGEAVAGLFAVLAAVPRTLIAVDLDQQQVRYMGTPHRFDIAPFRKECLLAGTDEIGFTLNLADDIARFEQAYGEMTPWSSRKHR
jgi:3-isopropylmalate/(R)-2-methylmalate dehydratase small subunit